MFRTRFALPVVVALLAACGAPPARMTLPGELMGSTQRVEIKGLGDRASGGFTSDLGGGRFDRSADRVALFNDVALLDRAAAHFTLDGTPSGTTGECRMVRNSSALAPAGAPVTLQPLIYQCALALSPGGAVGGLVLREETAGAALSAVKRSGTFEFGAVKFDIESINQLAGGALKTAEPVGYSLKRDGHTVAAIDLASRPALVLAPDLDADTRRAAMLAALSLGLLWDPGS